MSLAICLATPARPTCSTRSSAAVTNSAPLSSPPISLSNNGAPSFRAPPASSPSSTALPSTATPSTSMLTPGVKNTPSTATSHPCLGAANDPDPSLCLSHPPLFHCVCDAISPPMAPSSPPDSFASSYDLNQSDLSITEISTVKFRRIEAAVYNTAFKVMHVPLSTRDQLDPS